MLWRGYSLAGRDWHCIGLAVERLYTGRERRHCIGLAVERLYTDRERRHCIGLAVERLYTGRERRHCIGLAVERLYTGRERLTLCPPFHGAACSLLASGEGRK